MCIRDSVRTDRAGVESRREGAFMDNKVDALARQRSAANVHKQSRGLLRAGEFASTPGTQVVLQGDTKGGAHGDQSLFGAFSRYEDQVLVEVEVL